MERTDSTTTDRPTLPRSMRAVGRTEYGEADRLSLATAPVPSIAADQVLVRLHAASLDRGTWHVMAGKPYVMRLAGYGVRRPKVHTVGSDLAGVVVAVGSDVESLREGDEVFGACNGSFAEYAAVKARNLAPRPTTVSFDQAAALPVSALTALQAVRDRAKVVPGERVLVIGASGGVGTFAVQIAKAFGAEVTGVCSAAKVDLVRSLGADHVIDYSTGDITDAGAYDVILDIGGNRTIRHLRSALTPKGRLVIVGGEGGGDWFGLGRQLRAMLLSPFVGQRLGTFIASTNRADLEALATMVDDGTLRVAVDRTIALADVPDAVRDMQAGRISGKVVVHIGA